MKYHFKNQVVSFLDLVFIIVFHIIIIVFVTGILKMSTFSDYVILKICFPPP